MLLLFAGDLAHHSRARSLSRGRALVASLSDLGWVVGSVVLLGIFPESLSPFGWVVVAVVAAVVLFFAVIQIRGIRQAWGVSAGSG